MKNRQLDSSLKAVLLGMVAVAQLLTSEAFAQGTSGAGNGGRGWVCYRNTRSGTPEISEVKLVDYVEKSKWLIDLGVDRPGVDDTDAMIEVALQRLNRVDRNRVFRVRTRLLEMKDPTLTYILDLDTERMNLALIEDANILFKPTKDSGCDEMQIAVNRTKPGFKDYKYIFVRQYLSKMSDRDRAGLYLHEAIYNDEANRGARTSDGSRELVRAVSSPEFSELTPKDYYAHTLSISSFPTVTINGRDYSNVIFNGDRIESGKVIEGRPFAYFLAALEDPTVKKVIELETIAQPDQRVFFDVTDSREVVKCGTHVVTDAFFSPTECNPLVTNNGRTHSSLTPFLVAGNKIAMRMHFNNILRGSEPFAVSRYEVQRALWPRISYPITGVEGLKIVLEAQKNGPYEPADAYSMAADEFVRFKYGSGSQEKYVTLKDSYWWSKYQLTLDREGRVRKMATLTEIGQSMDVTDTSGKSYHIQFKGVRDMVWLAEFDENGVITRQETLVGKAARRYRAAN